MTGMTNADGLVGREDAVEKILWSLEDPGLHGAWVVGEPGIGKSALAAEMMNRARHGAVPFQVRAGASLSDVPYGALFPFLPDTSERVLGSPLLVLRALQRRFAEVTAECGKPVLLVIDDAHELDQDSIHILEQLMMADVINLLAMPKGDGVNPPELQAMCREGLLTRIILQPLNQRDVTSFMQQFLGGPVTQGSCEFFGHQSRGNPLMLKVLLSSGVNTGQLTQRNGIWLADPSVHVVDQSITDMGKNLIHRCTSEERTVLEVVSLIGLLPLPFADELVDMDSLQNLLNDGTIEVPTSRGNCVEFTYPVLSEVIRDLVPVGRSSAVYHQLFQLTGGAPATVIGLLRCTEWRMDIGERVREPDLVQAASEANSVFDSERALKLTQAVNTPEVYAAAQVESARAWIHRAAVGQAAVAIEGALEASIDLLTAGQAAMTSVGVAMQSSDSIEKLVEIAGRWLESGARISGLARSARPAADFIPPEQGAKVISALCLKLEGENLKAEILLRGIIEASGGNPQVEMAARSMLGEVLAAVGSGEEAAEQFLRALELVRATPALDCHYPSVVVRQLTSLLLGGRYDDFRAATAMHGIEAPKHMKFFSGEVTGLQGILAIKLGRFRPGLNRLSAGIEMVRDNDPELLLPYFLACAAYAAAQLGEHERARSFATQYNTIGYTAPRAQLLVSDSYLIIARAESTLSGKELDCISYLADEARDAGMTSAEREILELLTLLGESGNSDRLAALTQDAALSVLHVFALAVRSGDPQQLLNAGMLAESVGNQLLAADCSARSARAYGEQGQVRRQKAALHELGIRAGVLDGARTAAMKASGVSSPGLTSREKEIVELVISGAPNRQIAKVLTVSPRTVEGHLYRIYMKLGVTHREDLNRNHLTG